MRPVVDGDDKFAYERLIDAVVAWIRNGNLAPGERLPSVRRLSLRYGVSVSTVMRAYRELEARGVIGSRPRSGFFVLPPGRHGSRVTETLAHLPDPGEIATADLIMRTLELVADPELVPLGTALPDPDLLPSALLARHLAREMRRQARQATVLATPSGVPQLRQQIARRALLAGYSVAPDDIVVTCGCAEAITLCLRALTRPGDTVAVESPAYFGVLQALDVLGLRAVEIPVDPTSGISLAVLERALTRSAVAAVVVTPGTHNPLGCTLPDDRKRDLVELLRVHGVPAIEDDTYGELSFAEQRPRSLRAFDRAGLVITCGSFSKTLAPGYRLGWAVPGKHRDRVLHLKQSTTAACPVPGQLAVASYLSSGAYEPLLRRLRTTFRANVDEITREIEVRFPSGTEVSRPTGGFLLWVRLPAGVDALQLQRAALSQGLSVAPGPAFSASGAYTNYIRLNAGYRLNSRTATALERLSSVVTKLALRGRHRA